MTPETAQWLLTDLRKNHLSVVIVGTCRVVESRNPEWYQELCSMHQSYRKRPRKTFKSDTKIKRRDILRLLTRLAEGLPASSRYIEDLEMLAEKHLQGDDDGEIPQGHEEIPF